MLKRVVPCHDIKITRIVHIDTKGIDLGEETYLESGDNGTSEYGERTRGKKKEGGTCRG